MKLLLVAILLVCATGCGAIDKNVDDLAANARLLADQESRLGKMQEVAAEEDRSMATIDAQASAASSDLAHAARADEQAHAHLLQARQLAGDGPAATAALFELMIDPDADPGDQDRMVDVMLDADQKAVEAITKSIASQAVAREYENSARDRLAAINTEVELADRRRPIKAELHREAVAAARASTSLNRDVLARTEMIQQGFGFGDFLGNLIPGAGALLGGRGGTQRRQPRHRPEKVPPLEPIVPLVPTGTTPEKPSGNPAPPPPLPSGPSPLEIGALMAAAAAATEGTRRGFNRAADRRNEKMNGRSNGHGNEHRNHAHTQQQQTT